MTPMPSPFSFSALGGGNASDAWRGPSERAKRTSAAQAKILIVDDEAAICSSLQRIFSRMYTVVSATSAAAAMEHFRAGERFDVVLCDLMMPEMGGLELFHQIEAVSPGSESRFVFMSGAVMSPTVHARLAALPNQLLKKPFDMRRLVEIVNEMMKKTA